MKIDMVDPDEAKFSPEYLEIRNNILAAQREGKALIIRDIADVKVRQIVRSVGRELKIKGISTVKGDDELVVLLPKLAGLPLPAGSSEPGGSDPTSKPDNWAQKAKVHTDDFLKNSQPISTKTHVTARAERAGVRDGRLEGGAGKSAMIRSKS